MSPVRKCTSIYKSMKEKCASRGHLFENIISTPEPVRKRTCEYTNCTKPCNALKACSKTQMFYTKMYNHDAFCPKTYTFF